MAKTAVADIIIPTEFEKYAIERTAELSRFGDSGIIEMAPEFNALADGGGREVKMPFWKDLTATRQLLSDSASLTVNKVTSDQDIARIHNDGQVWSVNHLAKVISGDDPMQAIVDLVAGYWTRTDEGLVISALKGVFAAGSMSANLLAIHSESIAAQTSATRLNGATFVDACAKLGDAADRLTAVAMHSATEAALRKLDLIDFIPDSEGKAMLRTFQGRRVVVDDTLPTRTGTTDGTVYTMGKANGAAAEAMRRILVESARRKKRLKHGGQLERVDADAIDLPFRCPMTNCSRWTKRWILWPRWTRARPKW